MKILVIGGSYFLGRMFVLEAEKDGDILTVLNRGTHPLQRAGITEIRGDRHEDASYLPLKGKTFDIIVDFCAFERGDIEQVFRVLNGCFRQYLFVSTVDVYRRQTGTVKDEGTPFEERNIPGEAGRYICGKVALEKELVHCSEKWGIPWTVVRPGMIYGPHNYAPRENWYVKQIVSGKPVFYPVDAKGRFQFVYVKDVALMMLALCGKEKAFCEAFNICNAQPVDYALFFEVLEAAELFGTDIRRGRISDNPSEYYPFPLTEEETELYDGTKIQKLTGLSYADFFEQMKKTMHYFYEIFADGVKHSHKTEQKAVLQKNEATDA